MKTPEQIMEGQLNDSKFDKMYDFHAETVGEFSRAVRRLQEENAQLREDKLTLEEDNHSMRERLKELERAVQDAAQKAQDLADGIRRI